jgi:hypothetical protein
MVLKSTGNCAVLAAAAGAAGRDDDGQAAELPVASATQPSVLLLLEARTGT